MIYATGKYKIPNAAIAMHMDNKPLTGANHKPIPNMVAQILKPIVARMVRPSHCISFLRLHARAKRKFLTYPLITTPTGIDKYPRW